MSAGQPASQAGIGQTVVPYSTFQEAFQKDPAQVHDAVQAATAAAAGGDPALQQQMLADWHTAVSELSDSAKPVMKMGADGASILHTPQNDMASRLQSLLLNQATAAGQVGSLQPAQVVKTPEGDSFAPGVLFVKFDDADLIGWLGMAPELIFKPTKAAWIDPSPVPETIPDDARIAVFGDWGTGLYGAPAIASTIASLDRCDVVFHIGDTYYSGETNEVTSRLVGELAEASRRNIETFAQRKSRDVFWRRRLFSGASRFLPAARQLLCHAELKLDTGRSGHCLRGFRFG